MSSPVTPSDTLLGPIRAQLALVAQQIVGIGECFTEVPAGTVPDNSVLFPCPEWDIKDATNGRLDIVLHFQVMHLFADHDQLQVTLAAIEKFIPAWFTVLTATSTLTLGGTATFTSLVGVGKITQVVHAGQPYIGFVQPVDVRTEFAIPA